MSASSTTEGEIASTEIPHIDPYGILEALSRRIGAFSRGGDLDVDRAATHLVRWWRAGAHMKDMPTRQPKTVRGWGLDFDFEADVPLGTLGPQEQDGDVVQEKMDATVKTFVEAMKGEGAGMGISATRKKKKEKDDRKRFKVEKRKEKLSKMGISNAT